MRSTPLLGGTVLAAVLLATSTAQAQLDPVLTRRTTGVFGNFLVGYAVVVDSGQFSELLFGLSSVYSQLAADSGSVNGSQGGLPVEGSASFSVQQAFSFAPTLISGEGRAANTGSTPYSYVSLGANGQSTLALEFRVLQSTPFKLTGEVLGDPGIGVGAATSQGLAAVQFTGTPQGGLWQSDLTPGAFSTSGVLEPASTYRLYGNAVSAINGSASYRFNLALSPVPEPSTWALLSVGVGALLWRRRVPPTQTGDSTP